MVNLFNFCILHPILIRFGLVKSNILLAPKKTDNYVEIVKIVNVFKKVWTKAILMRKDVPNPGKLVWGPYDQPFSSNMDFSIDFGGKLA